MSSRQHNADSGHKQHATLPDFEIFQEESYKKARFEAHNALFWMARGANSFLDPIDGNRHLDLNWQDEKHILSTAIFDGDLQIGLTLPKLEMFFQHNGEKVKHSFWFDERTPAFVEAWYLVELLHRDRDRGRFSIDLPFTSANMLLGDTQEHEASAVATELQAIHDMIVFTRSIFASIEGFLSEHIDDRESKLLCSPEAFRFKQHITDGKTNGSVIDLGLSVGDDLRPTPFYFAINSNSVSASHNHPLDYEPSTILSLEVIHRDKMSQDDIIQNLLEKSIQSF